MLDFLYNIGIQEFSWTIPKKLYAVLALHLWVDERD